MNSIALPKPVFPSLLKSLGWLTAFSIAMGFLETSVVVYLRELYYPGGFAFPLTPVTGKIAVTEFWREAATIIMLLGAGYMAGKNRTQKFVLFLYCFAVWDIFYYVFLYVLLGWPASLFTWDILFLIPVPWVGPVLAPCMIACGMIAFAVITLIAQHAGKKGQTNWKEKFALVSGCVVMLYAFMWDYFQFVKKHPAGQGMWTLSSDTALFSEAATYVPEQFNWPVFLAGFFIAVAGLVMFSYRMFRKNKL